MLGSKPKQRKKKHQQGVNRCSSSSSWAILCCCSILAFTVVRGAGLPLGGDEEDEAAAASLDVDASWDKAREIPQTLFGVFFEVFFNSSFLS